jgi:hypothetical protein
MLNVYIGVVRFPNNHDFIIMVDGELPLVEDAVRGVVGEIWGEGEILLTSEGIDFREFVHQANQGGERPDGYVLRCEVSSSKRIDYAVQYARRLRKLQSGQDNL